MVNAKGNITYQYSDLFTDQLRIRDKGSEAIGALVEELGIEKTIIMFRIDISKLPNSSDPKEISDKWRNITDVVRYLLRSNR